MNYLYILLIALTSCSIDEVIPPIPKIECPHTITIEQQDTQDQLRLVVVSDLDYVWVTVGDFPRKKISRNFYGCISYHIPKDEISITIEAEQTCEYIY